MSRWARRWWSPALLATLLAGALSLLPTTPASAAAGATYWVGASGDDAGPGTRAQPWLTLQHAVDAAPAGSTVKVRTGTYAPFAVTKPDQTVTAADGQTVVVQGSAQVRDVVLLAAPGTRLLGMTVAGCVPDPDPAGGFEENGSSAIRVDDAAAGVTISRMTIRDSQGWNLFGLPFGCFGIFVHGADGSHLLGNDISGTGTGIYFNGGGRAASVAGNNIHDNFVIVRNTPGGNDDFGGGAVSFTNLTAEPGPTASGNVLTNNTGPSSDYQADGGGFELYNASHVTIEDNLLANNENVLETGTAPGGTCTGNTFRENASYGRVPGSTLGRSVGMILRCATDMRVVRNTFTEIDWWVFTLEGGDQFASDVQGLTITGNTFVQEQKVYHLGVDPVANGVVVDRNRIHFTGPVFASYLDGGTSPGVADWRRRSGLDLNSTRY